MITFFVIADIPEAERGKYIFVDLCPGRENRDGTSGKWPGNPGKIETLGLGA